MIFGSSRVAPEKAVFRPALTMSFMPGISEMQMNKMTYREQLLHPNWQRKRLEILQRDDFACQLCYDKESTLHVHHKQYGKGRMAWEYPADELVTLCEECHDIMHEQNAMMRDIVAKLPIDGPGCVVSGASVLAGWAHGTRGMDMSHIYQLSPDDFVAGQVAMRLADECFMADLLDAVKVLSDGPRWVIRSEFSKFLSAIKARNDEPPPPYDPSKDL